MHDVTPPDVREIPHTFTEHGYTRTDSFAWMRDKSNPAVLAHLEEENAYTAAVTAPLQPLRDALYAEMLGRIKQTDAGVPYRRGDYWYYARTVEGSQYPIFCRRAAVSPVPAAVGRPDELAAPEQVLLDLNVLARDRAFVALGASAVSDDGNRLAYTIDTSGYRQYTLFVRDLRSGATIGEPIERVDEVVWAADNETLVYVTQDAITKRADRLWRRSLTGGVAAQLYFEADEMYDVGIRRTRDGAWIVIGSTAKDTTEFRYLAAARPHEEPLIFAARRDGVQYWLDIADDRAFVRTNDRAPDFALYAAALETPERDTWHEIVGQRSGTTLTGVELFAGFIAVSGRRAGLASIEILDLATGALTPIEFAADDYVIDLGDNESFATHAVRFTYESLITPKTTLDYDVTTGKQTRLKGVEVPGYDSAAYSAERRFVPARDGTLIPVSLVKKKAAGPTSPPPLLLYGYGSYGISIDPHFSAPRLSLLDRGVTFAIAHVRGGGEFGEAWRLAGNLRNKRTTFTDFIDVADALVAAGDTTRERLSIEGASAGGLLVGAVVNMRPDLCAAAIAKVPFVDVLTTMLDATLPLTTGEFREWGNPVDRAAYDYMRSYSPLDNVARAPYPAMLVEVSYNDSQTPYWEGAKFAAKVRRSTTSGKPVLLKANLTAGHGGSSGRYDRLRELAFGYAFALGATTMPDSSG